MQSNSWTTLHLNTEPGLRGGEVQTLGLVRHLKASGRRALLAGQPESPLSQRAAELGLEFLPLRVRGEWDLLAAWRLKRMARAHGVALVHAHTAHALAVALAARFLGGEFAVVASRRVSFPLRSAGSKAKYRRADAVIGVSEAIRSDLAHQGIPEEKLFTVHSGVDLSRFATLPSREEARKGLEIHEDRIVVGAVGALEPHKGHGTLLEAFNEVWREIPHALLLLVGDGKRRKELTHHAEARGIPCYFAGQVKDPAPLLPAMDLFILPSSSGEGSPGVIKEAAAVGVPVIATDVSGTREILRDGAEALLVKPHRQGELTAAMLRLLKDGDYAKKLAAEAKGRVQEFSMERMAERTWEVYGKILGAR